MHQQRNKQMSDGALPSASKPASQAQKSKAKARGDTAFQRYMKNNYFEHFRRVISWRRAARWALFVYPLTSALAIAAPFIALHAVARQLYKVQPEWFTNFLSPDTQSFVLPALLALSGAALLLGLLTGVGLGISRARMLTFEAERTELNVRHSYFLRRIARTHRGARRRYLE